MNDQRAQALVYIQRCLPSASQEEAAEEERRLYEMAFGLHGEDTEAYRSCVREAMLGHRSGSQSPLLSDEMTMCTSTFLKSIPVCEGCERNDCVTYVLVQRCRSDEGMTPEYTCSRCQIHWS